MTGGTASQNSTEFGPDGGGRMKGVSIVKPVVYGNTARYFGKKREEDGHTHEWTIYLKPFHNEDMSTYIKKVQFKLHESYANQTRVLTRPPYEVTETGWGEFEIGIKIFFHDPNERPVTIYHILKLFQSSPGTSTATPTGNLPSASTTSAASTTPVAATTTTTSTTSSATTTTTTTTTTSLTGDGKKILVAESYEELVFQEPSAMLHQLLQNSPQLTLAEHRHYTDFPARKKATVASVASAAAQVAEEAAELRSKIVLAKETLAVFKEKMAEAQAEQSLLGD